MIEQKRSTDKILESFVTLCTTQLQLKIELGTWNLRNLRGK